MESGVRRRAAGSGASSAVLARVLAGVLVATLSGCGGQTEASTAAGSSPVAVATASAPPPTAPPPTAPPSVSLTVPPTDSPTAPPMTGAGEKLDVTAAFYPLQYLAERVGGDRLTVRNLAKPGAEPHDLELSPQDVAQLGAADLVVYLGGFQPAVDEAVEQSAPGAALDTAAAARLDRGPDEHKETESDPHFWLDPIRLAAVGEQLAERLGGLDSASAGVYRTNAAALRRDLEALDAEYRAGTATCASRDLVTSHAAFGYLAARYGLRQRGISGLSPDSEPSPRQLADVADFVRTASVRTIYYETLLSPEVARTVAAETGAQTAVLDPIEGLEDSSPGTDYLQVMRANLAALRKGQACS